MTAISNYLENKVLDHFLRGSALSAPNIWASLYTASAADDDSGPEVSGNEYARLAVSAWDAAASRQIASTNVATFAPASGGNWGTISHFGLHDTSSGGNLLWYGALDSTVVVQDGDIFEFGAGGLIVGIGGDISTYAANAFLDHVFGNSTLAAPTPWVSLHSADPGLTGASEYTTALAPEYVRVQVATWDAPVGGATENTNAFTNYVGEAPFFGIWDASTSGNFLFGGNATDSTTETGQNIIAGALDVVVT